MDININHSLELKPINTRLFNFVFRTVINEDLQKILEEIKKYVISIELADRTILKLELCNCINVIKHLKDLEYFSKNNLKGDTVFDILISLHDKEGKQYLKRTIRNVSYRSDNLNNIIQKLSYYKKDDDKIQKLSYYKKDDDKDITLEVYFNIDSYKDLYL